MDLAKLEELKQKLISAKELADVWSFFLDHLGENDEFLALGERTSHPFIEGLIAQLGKEMFGQDGRVTHMLLVRVANQNFIHGGFGLGGRMGGVIFFEDSAIGLMAVAENPPKTDAKFARFSAQPLPKRGEPSRN